MTIETLEPRAAYALWATTYPAHAHNPLMQAEERAVLELLPADLRRLRILDAGCGSGRYMRHARQRGATSMIGVDLSHEMLRQAAAEARIQADLTALPLQSGWADLVICGLTIGHVADLAAALAELRRVSRPGARLLISDFHPEGAARGWRREFRAAGRRYAVRHHIADLAQWKQQCAACDLEIIAVREPLLDPADIPPGARFDPAALQIPAALVLALKAGR